MSRNNSANTSRNCSANVNSNHLMPANMDSNYLKSGDHVHALDVDYQQAAVNNDHLHPAPLPADDGRNMEGQGGHFDDAPADSFTFPTSARYRRSFIFQPANGSEVVIDGKHRWRCNRCPVGKGTTYSLLSTKNAVGHLERIHSIGPDGEPTTPQSSMNWPTVNIYTMMYEENTQLKEEIQRLKAMLVEAEKKGVNYSYSNAENIKLHEENARLKQELINSRTQSEGEATIQNSDSGQHQEVAALAEEVQGLREKLAIIEGSLGKDRLNYILGLDDELFRDA